MTLASIGPPPGVPLVYLVDDEDVVRDAVAWLLRSRRLLSQGFASAESFEASLPEAAAESQDDWPTGPSCLLLDLRMGGMSGLTLFDRLLQRGLTDALPVIFLTGHGDVATAVSAVKRGAFDFVEKPFSNNALVDRVESALAASAAALTVRAGQRHVRRRLDQLNDRERQVMRMIADGRANREIAEALYLSVRTVENHRAHVFEKLGVGSAVELANLLHGIVR
jgi:two-component system response regulator DctR